jgi:hypothetical protein
MILSLIIWLPSFQSWIFYQSFNHPYCTQKDPQKKKKTNKQTLYHLSIILLLQVSGVIHPPKVYKASFFFFSFC